MDGKEKQRRDRVRCCIGCGRDTSNVVTGICLDCIGLGNRRDPKERRPRDDDQSPDDDEEYIRKRDEQ